MAARPTQTTPGHEVGLLLAAELLSAEPVPSSLPAPSGLQVCPACSQPFVVPGKVREVVASNEVRLDLHCTNCGVTRTAVHTDQDLAALDMAMDRSFADLLWSLEVVWIANEEAAIQRFSSALDADLIVPEDF